MQARRPKRECAIDLSSCCLAPVGTFHEQVWSFMTDHETRCCFARMVVCAKCGRALKRVVRASLCMDDCADVLASAHVVALDHMRLLESGLMCDEDGRNMGDSWRWIVSPVDVIHLCVICRALRGRTDRLIARVGIFFGVLQKERDETTA